MKAFLTSSAFLVLSLMSVTAEAACKRKACPVYVHVNRAEQLLYLYLDQEPVAAYHISSGRDGFTTPAYSGHPIAGRIYEAYDSKKYPQGDYRGLGNMPYAMFFNGGYAIHGTPEGNFMKLGTEASHGCIRMYPDQAKELNQLVRKVGVNKVWFEID